MVHLYIEYTRKKTWFSIGMSWIYTLWRTICRVFHIRWMRFIIISPWFHHLKDPHPFPLPHQPFPESDRRWRHGSRPPQISMESLHPHDSLLLAPRRGLKTQRAGGHDMKKLNEQCARISRFTYIVMPYYIWNINGILYTYHKYMCIYIYHIYIHHKYRYIYIYTTNIDIYIYHIYVYFFFIGHV